MKPQGRGRERSGRSVRVHKPRPQMAPGPDCLETGGRPVTGPGPPMTVAHCPPQTQSGTDRNRPCSLPGSRRDPSCVWSRTKTMRGGVETSPVKARRPNTPLAALDKRPVRSDLILKIYFDSGKEELPSVIRI